MELEKTIELMGNEILKIKYFKKKHPNFVDDELMEAYEETLKVLKAMKIVKDKVYDYAFISLEIFKTPDGTSYRIYDSEDRGFVKISKEEFKIFSEVLKWQPE